MVTGAAACVKKLKKCRWEKVVSGDDEERREDRLARVGDSLRWRRVGDVTDKRDGQTWRLQEDVGNLLTGYEMKCNCKVFLTM